jgi:hypothetical protein
VPASALFIVFLVALSLYGLALHQWPREA